mmetsp:Transcript_8823/g.34667  ORF Transcript_8823/g.34667 Transcript_8823/m.34667 type:complete len:258 (+) Transcript_8823:806-1579(+)
MTFRGSESSARDTRASAAAARARSRLRRSAGVRRSSSPRSSLTSRSASSSAPARLPASVDSRNEPRILEMDVASASSALMPCPARSWRTSSLSVTSSAAPYRTTLPSASRSRPLRRRLPRLLEPAARASSRWGGAAAPRSRERMGTPRESSPDTSATLRPRSSRPKSLPWSPESSQWSSSLPPSLPRSEAPPPSSLRCRLRARRPSPIRPCVPSSPLESPAATVRASTAPPEVAAPRVAAVSPTAAPVGGAAAHGSR